MPLDTSLNLMLALKGNPHGFRVLLQNYAVNHGWSAETLRNRWVGTKALLVWWNSLGNAPSLNELNHTHAKLFYQSLAKLSHSTKKSYFKGARNGLQALGRAMGLEGYDPWKGFIVPKQTLPAPNLSLVPLYKQHRVIALVHLLNAGYSVAKACRLEWIDYLPEQARFRGSRLALQPEAHRWFSQRARYSRGKVVVWKAATARKWLKLVYTKPA